MAGRLALFTNMASAIATCDAILSPRGRAEPGTADDAFGVQKTLGAHPAVRAGLTVGVGLEDDGASPVLLPAVGAGIPIGRYP